MKVTFSSIKQCKYPGEITTGNGILCLSILIILTFTSFKNSFKIEHLLVLKYKAGFDIRNGKYHEAYRDFKRIDRMEPLDFESTIAFAKVSSYLGKYSEAIEYLYKFRNSTNSIVRKSYLDAWQGIIYAQCKEYRKGNRAFKQSLDLAVKSSICDSLLVGALFNNIACLNLLSSAIECTPPENPHFTFYLSDILRILSYLETAKKYLPLDSNIIQNYVYLSHFDPSMEISFPIEQHLCGSNEISPKGNTSGIASTLNVPVSQEQTDMISLVPGLDKLISKLQDYDQIVFLVDHSGSMEEVDNIVLNYKKLHRSRYDVLLFSIDKIIGGLSKQKRIGVISIGDECGSFPRIAISTEENLDHNKLLKRIHAIQPNGLTPLNKVFIQSEFLFSNQKVEKKTVILLTDGVNTCGGSMFDICILSQRFKEKGIDIYVLSYLLENSENRIAYSVYNCLSTKEFFGITDRLELVDMNVSVLTPINTLLIPQTIETGLCLNGAKRFRLNVNSARFSMTQQHFGKYQAEF